MKGGGTLQNGTMMLSVEALYPSPYSTQWNWEVSYKSLDFADNSRLELVPSFTGTQERSIILKFQIIFRAPFSRWWWLGLKHGEQRTQGMETQNTKPQADGDHRQAFVV